MGGNWLGLWLAEILPTRPSVDPNEVTRPMDEIRLGSASTPSDWSGLQLTTVSPSVVTPSHHTSTTETLHRHSFRWNNNRDLHAPYSTVSFRMTLSDLAKYSMT